MRISRRNKVLITGVAITLIIFLVLTSRRSNKADFSRFETAKLVEDYLGAELPLDETSMEQLHQWLSVKNIVGCRSFSDVLYPDLDGDYQRVESQVRCTVSAPYTPSENRSWWDNLLMRSLVEWDYDLDFLFENDLLSAIRVLNSATGF